MSLNLRRLGVVSAISVAALAGSVMDVTPALAQGNEPVMGPPVVETEQAPASPPLNLRKQQEQPLELRQESGGLGWGAKIGLVGLAFAGAYFMYRRKAGAGAGQTMGPIARVVGRTAIGPRSSVVIVEVDGHRLLLGVTPNSINTLSMLGEEPKLKGHEIDDDYEQSRPVAPAPMPEAEAPRWAPANDKVDVEASLNRLIAQARGEIDEQPTRHQSGAAPRALRERDPEPVRESARESARDITRASTRESTRESSRDLGREIPREPTSIASRRTASRQAPTPLEGQVRGLGRRSL